MKKIMEQKLPGSILEKEDGKIWEVTGLAFVNSQKWASMYPNQPIIRLNPGAHVIFS